MTSAEAGVELLRILLVKILCGGHLMVILQFVLTQCLKNSLPEVFSAQGSKCAVRFRRRRPLSCLLCKIDNLIHSQ